MPRKKHLVGAHGLFWERSAVDWTPGSGRAWQLLGVRGRSRATARVCDFRRARGFYVLFNDYGATYVGLARGTDGLGQRLRKHTKDQFKDWSRFCWFSFDDVVATQHTGWDTIDLDDNTRDVSAETAIRELEALMIKILGIKNQNQMRFHSGELWRQATWEDCYPDGVLSKVENSSVTTPSLRDALDQLSPP